MRSDWERTCLMSMATKRKRQGLSRAEAIQDIDAALRGFSTRFHISRAVSAAYNGPITEF
ncbi:MULTISPECIES: hypothetical protein [unclassified Roseobacter]|uniref:hypothetical protein n=1 Tax=unclassified Roseobacter TaxID=196798 RepID=UPI0018A2F674|nr:MULTISPECIES: hypothetical protein [unclassified Roseobacter]MDW3181438.1 hypothetical protein [Roseobacter sp.]